MLRPHLAIDTLPADTIDCTECGAPYTSAYAARECAEFDRADLMLDP